MSKTLRVLLSCIILATGYGAALAQLQLNSPWPKYNAAASNNGLGLGSGSHGAEKWSTPMGTGTIAPPVIGANGTIYVGDNNGILHALKDNGSTVSVKWTLTLDLNSEISGSPAVGIDGTVYVPCQDGNVYAVTDNGTSGVIKWTYSTGYFVRGGVAIGADGTIYVGSDNHRFFALTDSGSSATFKWYFVANDVIRDTPAIGGDGSIYFGSNDGNLYCLFDNGSSYTEEWSFAASAGITTSSPAVGSNGLIYFADNNGNVYALKNNGSSAHQQWTTSLGGQSPFGPAIGSNGILYFGHSQGLSAVADKGTSGSVNWTQNIGDIQYSSPAIGADGTVYVGSNNGRLYAVTDLGTSAFQPWAFYTNGPIYSPPIVGSDGTVFFGSYNDNFYAIGQTILSQLKTTTPQVLGGQSAQAEIVLNGKAGTDGDTVLLFSNNSNVTVPSSVTVPAGTTYAYFTFTTSPVSGDTNVLLSAQLGSSTASLVVTVMEAVPHLIKFLPTASIQGGSPTTGEVVMSGKAGPYGLTVTLGSGTTSVATVGSTVNIPAGSTYATFPISTSPVDSSTGVQISASLDGVTAYNTLTVTPSTLSYMKVVPTSIAGGAQATGEAILTGKAGPSGTVVNLQSSNTAVASVPTSCKVSAGVVYATFKINTSPVNSSTNVTITGSIGAMQKTVVLTVTPPKLVAFNLSPATVTGGFSSTGQAYLNEPTGSSGLSVTVLSNNTAATVPASVFVAGGTSEKSFTVTTVAVDSTTYATISAKLGSVQLNKTLTINPPVISAVKLIPASVKGGTNLTGEVVLNGKAGPSGLTVTVSNNNGSVAYSQTSVFVPAGANYATFPISTYPVTTQTIVQFTAITGSTSASGNLTVTP